MVGQADAGGEAGDGVHGRDALDLGPVFALVLVARIEEAGVEAGLVGEEQQALAVGVEPAERVNAGRQARGEVGESSPRGAGLGG